MTSSPESFPVADIQPEINEISINADGIKNLFGIEQGDHASKIETIKTRNQYLESQLLELKLKFEKNQTAFCAIPSCSSSVLSLRVEALMAEETDLWASFKAADEELKANNFLLTLLQATSTVPFPDSVNAEL